MGIQVRQTAAWHTIPTTRVMWVRMGAKWQPVLDLWIRDQGAWHKEPTYSPQLAVPTNLRMNPASSTNHSTIPVAWDYTGVLPPDSYRVVLTNEAGATVQDKSSTTTSYTFTGLTQDTRYKVKVSARCGGRADTAFTPSLNWYLGKDAYTHSVSSTAWGSPYSWKPASYAWAGSWDADHPPNLAIDGSFGTQWLSLPDADTGGYQGDGIRFRFPTGHHQLLGCQAWLPTYGGGHTVWYGVYQGGSWKGGQNVYVGSLTPLVHLYLGGQNSAPSGSYELVNMYTGGPAPGQGSTGTYITDATSDGSVDLLFQSPVTYTGWTGLRYGAWEIRLVLTDWVTTTTSVTDPAKPSGSY
jgi:fibronectin type III domain protein